MDQVFVCVLGPCAEKNRRINSLDQLCKHVQMRHLYQEIDPNEDNVFVCVDRNCKSGLIRGRQNIKRHYENTHMLDETFPFLVGDQHNHPPEPIHQPINRSIEQHVDQPMPDLMDSISSMSIEEGSQCFGFPILLDAHVLEPSDLESKFCELIISHKRDHKTTEQAALNMANDHLDFFLSYLDEGKYTNGIF